MRIRILCYMHYMYLWALKCMSIMIHACEHVKTTRNEHANAVCTYPIDVILWTRNIISTEIININWNLFIVLFYCRGMNMFSIYSAIASFGATRWSIMITNIAYLYAYTYIYIKLLSDAAEWYVILSSPPEPHNIGIIIRAFNSILSPRSTNRIELAF